jgi:hypothetical protein
MRIPSRARLAVRQLACASVAALALATPPPVASQPDFDTLPGDRYAEVHNESAIPPGSSELDPIYGFIAALEHPLLSGPESSAALALATHVTTVAGRAEVVNANPFVLTWVCDHSPGKFCGWLARNPNLDPVLNEMPPGAGFNVLIAPEDSLSFEHQGSEENRFSNWTVIDHPAANGNPSAILFFTESGGTFVQYGLWYTPSGRWAIFREDLSTFLSGSFFVRIAPAHANVFVHTATVANTAFEGTSLDHPALNGRPGAWLLVAHNWNPPGRPSGVYNDHPVGVRYDDLNERWTIVNLDGADMPFGISFNVMADTYVPLHADGFEQHLTRWHDVVF